RCHDHVRGTIERIRAVTGDARLPERQQHTAVRTELDDLMSLVVRLIRSVRGIGDPHVAVAIDVYAVRHEETAGAEAGDKGAGHVELEDRREWGIKATGAAATLRDPDGLT